MSNVLRAYQSQFMKQFIKRPLVANMVTAGTLCFTGDIIAQRLLEKNSKHDWSRSLRMTGFGVLWWAPITTYWLG